jgi:Putative MetA-pathway of phenol degradation
MSHERPLYAITTPVALLLLTSILLQGEVLAQSPDARQDDSALSQFMRAVLPEATEDEESGDSQRNDVEEFIETDRNSFTFARMTAGANRLIVESSYSFIDLSGEKIKNSFPELLLRYGIGDRFEFRLGWNYETGRERKPDAGNIAGFFGADAEQQIYYGFKAVVTRPSGWIPQSAFLAQGHTPTGGPQSVTQLRIGYVVGWKLPNRWDFDAGFRFGTDNDDGHPYVMWAPSAVLKIPLTPNERLFTHVEYFSLITNGKQEDTAMHFVDTSLHYLITPSMEVGGIIAFGPHSHGLNIVTNVGIGIRF